METEDVYTVTLYDWKEDSPLTARTGTYRWHVGGLCADAPYLVEDILEDYRRNKTNG